MQKLKRFFSLPVFLIVLLIGILFYTNYTPGTWLSGWDNLHPEFNFGTNIYRSLFSVWQEYQGLGLLAGMAHASDLVHQLFLFVLSFVMPASLLRYFYHFFMLLVGTLGTYFFLKNIVFSGKTKRTKHIAAFLGSVLYLLNLGTIAYFFVPFEPYSTFWGMFPWEMYVLFRYLQYPSRKALIALILVNLLATPQAYVQTIFLVYFFCVSIVLGLSLFREKSRKMLGRVITIFVLILSVNAFWLLPNLYFTISDISVTQNAMQNQMATEKFFQMNQNRGTIFDLAQLKEFYYDFFDYDTKSDRFTYLLSSWRQHMQQLPITLLSAGIFLVVLFGLFRPNRYRPYFLGLGLLCAIVFLSDTIGVSLINALFRSLPVLNQILRNPFTKFIVPLVFVFAIGFASTMAYLLEKKPFQKTLTTYLLTTAVIFTLLLYAFPVFQGNLIAPQMRVKIPTEYFKLFDYFKTQDKNARIMNLPQGSFWGWNYYRFGMRGSGFLWYGIEQPIMDRAFDVWSNKLENYYWELSYALKKRDKMLFDQVLEKYQVSYILFDENVMFPEGASAIKGILHQQDFLRDNKAVKKIQQFGRLSIYKVNLKNKPTKNVSLLNSLPTVARSEEFTHTDQAFQTTGMYYEPEASTSASIFYPFGSLFTSRLQNQHAFNLQEDKNSFSLSQLIAPGNYVLTMPSYLRTETILPSTVQVKMKDKKLFLRFEIATPQMQINGAPIANSFQYKETELDLSTQENIAYPLFLSINNSDFFQLNIIPETYINVGTTYVYNANSVNTLKVFTAADAKTVEFAPKDFFKAATCGIEKGAKTVASGVSGKQLVLTVKNTAICSAYKKPMSGLGDALIHVAFSYSSRLDEYPKYCIYNALSHTCLNKKDNVRSGFSKNGQFNDYFQNEDNTADLSFQVILEATDDEDKDTQKQISYSNMRLTAYHYVTGGVFDLDTVQDTNFPLYLSLAKPSVLSISLPKLENSFSYVTPVAKNIYHKKPLNYDTQMPGEFSLTEGKGTEKFLNVEARNASSYLLFRASDLNPGNGYIAAIETRNKSGNPFTINLFTNTEFRNFAYSVAEKNPKNTKNYFVLPPVYKFDPGIAILLSSSSYNSSKSSNELIDLSIYPFPYTYLTKIYLQKQNTPLPVAKSERIQVTKHALDSYSVKTAQNASGVIVLSQAFHPGWDAYSMENGKWPMANLFPSIFGKKLEHVEVNGWENGWILPAAEEPRQTRLTQEVKIVFWPQQLQWWGFVVGIVGIAGALVWKPLSAKFKTQSARFDARRAKQQFKA